MSLASTAHATTVDSSPQVSPVVIPSTAETPSSLDTPSAASSTPALPAITIKGKPGTSTATDPVKGYIAPRSTTGTKTPSNLLETPQSVSTITRDEMNARGAQDVSQAIRYTPGVTVETYGPDSRGQDWLTLRGFSGFANALYLDGLPMAINNSYANQRSEAYSLESVDVMRGPSSVLYGQGDVGGIVHRVSKRPHAQAPREIELQVGNDHHRQLAADWGGILSTDGDWLYRLVGTGLSTDTREQYGNERGHNKRAYLAPSLRWQPTADTSLTFLSEWQRGRNRGFSFPYTEPIPPVGRPTSIYEGEPKFSGFDQDQSTLGYQFEHRANDTWALRQNMRVAEVSVDYRRVQGNGFPEDGHTLPRKSDIFQERTQQAVVDTQLQGQLQSGSVDHQLLMGLDLSARKLRKSRHSGSAPSLDTAQPVYGQAFDAPNTLRNDNREKLRQTGLYAQDQARWDKHWLMTLGARMDWATQQLDDAIDARLSQRQSDRAFSHRSALSYITDAGWAPYVSYGTSFLPQSGRDAQGQSFTPTLGKQYEVGAKFAPTDSSQTFTAALFDLTKSHVLTTDPDQPDFQRQSGQIRSRGVELESKASLARGLNAVASYAYNHVKVLQSHDGDQGKMPTGLPKQTASTWFDYSLPTGSWQGLGLGVGARYLGASFDDPANTHRTPGVTLFDAALHYHTGAWRWALNASNLSDKTYIATCKDACFWGAQRAVTLSGRYRW